MDQMCDPDCILYPKKTPKKVYYYLKLTHFGNNKSSI